jgi:hypothetical protein
MKGGKQVTEMKLPPWLEEAAKRNLARADEISRIGFVPYSGPDVAALTPDQEAAMRNTRAAASAFGLGAGAAPPQMPPTVTMGGVQGYTSTPLFEQALEELKQRRPGQYDAINALFINPFTGALPPQAQAPAPPPPPPPPWQWDERGPGEY